MGAEKKARGIVLARPGWGKSPHKLKLLVKCCWSNMRLMVLCVAALVVMSVVRLSTDITGGPCREYSYVLQQFHLHWGESDSAGSEHYVNGLPTAAEVRPFYLPLSSSCCGDGCLAKAA